MNKYLEQYGFDLTDKQIDLLTKFKDAVIENNKKFNLTSITDEKEFILKHIIDSLLIFKEIEWNYESVLDIGTGAGLPGVVLAIVKEETNFTLLDSTQKKIDFINEFAKENGIKNITAINKRAEEEAEDQYDLVTSRAVAPLPRMLEIASHYIKLNGDLILYKGRNIEEELCNKIKGTIDVLGLKYEEIIKYKLDEDNERTLIKYKKIKENKKGFPREWKDIKRKDLCN